MMLRARSVPRQLLLVVVLALPLVLLISSLQTFHEMAEQRAVYLRTRAAAVAGRLESVAVQSFDTEDLFHSLAETEPALISLDTISRSEPEAGDTKLAPIWNGGQLFLTQMLKTGGREVYRAYVPFHAAGTLHIARIDLDAAVADFLLLHARRNVIFSLTGGLVLVVLSLYTVWSANRNAQMARRQLALEHLAQLGRMGAVLAHEIRNPLGTIKGFAQLAEELGHPDVNPLMEPILSEAARLENLVNDLLLYARPSVPVLRDCNWRAIEAAVAAQARQVIGERRIRFVADGPEFSLVTDPNSLKQILNNLVRNAVDAVAEQKDPEVRLIVSQARSKVSLRVVDNGPPMSEEVNRRLFEPFFTTKASGTGLGLSICRSLVEALGGEIEIRRRADGGVEAVVILPLAAPAAASAAEAN